MSKLIAKFLRYLLSVVEPKVVKDPNFMFEVGQRFSLPFSKNGGEAEIVGRSVNRKGTRMYRVKLSDRTTNLSGKTISNSQSRGAWVKN